MITITPSGFTLSEPLVAGEPVDVSVSGFSLAEDAALSLICSACAANYALAVAELEAGEGGTWTGTLDTATQQTATFLAGASACESRGIRLELLDTAHRDSLAALCTPLVNSALVPSANPSAVPPIYLAVPGPPGPEGSAGSAGAAYDFEAAGSSLVEITPPADALLCVIHGMDAAGHVVKINPPPDYLSTAHLFVFTIAGEGTTTVRFGTETAFAELSAGSAFLAWNHVANMRGVQISPAP